MKIVDDVMQPVLCVPQDMTLRELCSVFERNGISGAPVVDSRDYLVGVVSLADVAHHVAEEKYHQWVDYHSDAGPSERRTSIINSGDDLDKSRVRDIMSQVVHRVSSQAPLLEVVELMISEGIHRIIVTHRDHVVGIVTTTDVLRVFRDRLRKSAKVSD